MWNKLHSPFCFALFLQSVEHKQFALRLPVEVAAPVAQREPFAAGCQCQLCSPWVVGRTKHPQCGPWWLCLWFVFLGTFDTKTWEPKFCSCNQAVVLGRYLVLAVVPMYITESAVSWGFISASLCSVLWHLSTGVNPRGSSAVGAT